MNLRLCGSCKAEITGNRYSSCLSVRRLTKTILRTYHRSQNNQNGNTRTSTLVHSTIASCSYNCEEGRDNSYNRKEIEGGPERGGNMKGIINHALHVVLIVTPAASFNTANGLACSEGCMQRYNPTTDEPMAVSKFKVSYHQTPLITDDVFVTAKSIRGRGGVGKAVKDGNGMHYYGDFSQRLASAREEFSDAQIGFHCSVGEEKNSSKEITTQKSEVSNWLPAYVWSKDGLSLSGLFALSASATIFALLAGNGAIAADPMEIQALAVYRAGGSGVSINDILSAFLISVQSVATIEKISKYCFEKVLPGALQSLEKMAIMEFWRRVWRVTYKVGVKYWKMLLPWNGKPSICNNAVMFECPTWLVQTEDFVVGTLERGVKKLIEKTAYNRFFIAIDDARAKLGTIKFPFAEFEKDDGDYSSGVLPLVAIPVALAAHFNIK